MHYFPLADVRPDLLTPAGQHRWSVRVGDRVAPEAVASAPDAEMLEGFVTVDYAAMDRWFEEDDPIYAHPRDPYHRVDVRASSRHVVVRYGDQTVAESSRPKLLFETGLPVRYYLPFADVRIGLLERSDTVSDCPYKGDGQHWHVRVDGSVVRDAGWSLPHPLPEGIPAAEHVCFYAEKVEVEVDGERIRD